MVSQFNAIHPDLDTVSFLKITCTSLGHIVSCRHLDAKEEREGFNKDLGGILFDRLHSDISSNNNRPLLFNLAILFGGGREILNQISQCPSNLLLKMPMHR